MYQKVDDKNRTILVHLLLFFYISNSIMKMYEYVQKCEYKYFYYYYLLS